MAKRAKSDSKIRILKPRNQSVTIEVTLSLGLGDLHKQKAWLLKQAQAMTASLNNAPSPPNVADGIINLYDYLQDEIVRQGQATERQVFKRVPGR